MSLKAALKRHLQNSGWFVRKTGGLPIGVDLFIDLKNFGIRPKCVFDIGAHHGQTALAYAGGFLGSSVFAFEPVSSNFAALKQITAGTPEIVPVHVALGDQSGRLDIKLNRENSQAHSFIRATVENTEGVDVTTVDDFCATKKLYPDFIKIDVEGFELKVIAGARHTLAKSPRALLVEATLNSTNKRHTNIADLVAALNPFGFRLAALYDQCQWETTGQLEFFNALFVKRSDTMSSGSGR